MLKNITVGTGNPLTQRIKYIGYSVKQRICTHALNACVGGRTSLVGRGRDRSGMLREIKTKAQKIQTKKEKLNECSRKVPHPSVHDWLPVTSQETRPLVPLSRERLRSITTHDRMASIWVLSTRESVTSNGSVLTRLTSPTVVPLIPVYCLHHSNDVQSQELNSRYSVTAVLIRDRRARFFHNYI